MNIKVLLAELQATGIRIQAQDGKLNIQSSVSPIPAEVLDKLKLHKASLLTYLEQVKREPDMSEYVLSDEEKTAGKEISPQQWALWPLYKLGKTANYNIPISYDLRGQLDTHRLADALKTVYLATNAFHSVFVERGDQVFMALQKNDNWCASIISGTEEVVRTQYQLEQQREFNIHSDPLFVAHIVNLAPDHSVLIINFPHIIIDGWSINVLFKHIVDAYNGQPSKNEQVDFYSYLAVEKPDYSKYWLQRLDSYEPAVLHSVSIPDTRQRHLCYELLPEPDLQLLQEQAAAAQVSLFSAALQCWGKALAKYLGQSEVVVSTPYANREKWQSVIGYLVSMVPIRINQAHSLADFQVNLYQDLDAAQCDFNALLPSLGLQTEAGRHPLQQAVFAWQDGLTGIPVFPNVSVERREVELTRAKFPLSLSVLPYQQGYQLKWEFDPTILSLETIKVLQSLFLAQIRGESATWIEPVTTISCDVNVVSLLAKQLDSSPTSIAVRKGHETLSYAQLWSQALHVAGHLQVLGISPGEKIGVCLSRDLNLCVALVGIVLAGGVYVPMAADESNTRLAELAELSQMRYCLSEALTIAGVEVCSLADILSHPAQPYTAVTLRGQSPIYVNFSSGTTGKPKGILCVHEGVCRLVHEQDFMQLDAQTQMLSAAAQTFDAFTLEFWGPLLNGGCVHLLAEPQLDNETLARLVEHDGVNTLWLTAALFHTLVDVDVQAFRGVQQLLVGGDVVSPKHVKAVYAINEQITIINGYGPTENTTFTTCYRIDREWDVRDALPIGHSIKGTQVHLIDAHRQPVTAGCIGEIVTTGQGLAAGYLDPEQEVGRFITLPILGESVRAYCTGDLGYIDIAGRLRFVGRADQQVKVNGFRVELDAIDRMFATLDNVQESVTLVIQQKASQVLISFVKLAYVSNDTAKLLHMLGEILPSYMLPNELLIVESLPLTDNGKVDRKQLTAYYDSYRLLAVTTEHALTKLEQAVADIWSEVLGREVCSPTDSFYRLGGNSLMQLMCQKLLAKKLGMAVDLKYLLKYQTLGELCVYIASMKAGNDEVSHVAHDATESSSLSEQQSRLYSIHQMHPSSAYNVPFCIYLPTGVNDAQVNGAVKHLLVKHPILWSKFVEKNQDVLQVSRNIEDFQLPIQQVNESELDGLLEQESQRIFELKHSSSVFRLIHVGSDKKALLFNVHHLCFDGASIATVIVTLDNYFCDRTELQSTSYAEYTKWQQSARYQQLCSEDLAYWAAELSGVSDNTSIPSDTLGEATQDNAGHYSQPLLPELVTGVKSYARQEGVTEYSFWMALFSLVVSRMSDKLDTVIATPVSNRTNLDFQNTIGFIANTLLIRTQPKDDWSFSEYLQRAHSKFTDALMHQGVPLTKLLDSMSITTATGKMPLTQVLFSMSVDGHITIKSQPVTVLSGKNTATKYDFFFTLSQTGASNNLQIEYNKDLYSEALVNSFAGAFQFVAQQVLQNTAMILGDIALAQQPQSATSEFAIQHTIVDSIFNRAIQQPHMPALRSGDAFISYAELLNQVSQTAAAMEQVGVQQGERVAIYTKRNINLPIYLLAVMQLGAVYVPLDESYPQKRTEHIIHNAQPKLIIKEDSFKLPEMEMAARVISVSELLALTQQCHTVEITPRARINDLAYIIYTSGSTGTPKGVSIGHLGIAQLTQWAKDTYAAEDFSLVYAGTSICFDLSVFELFVTLAIGGCAYVAKDQLTLVDDLPSLKISMINTVPSVFSAVLDSVTMPQTLKVVNLAGEIFHTDLARRIRDKMPQIKLLNLYGPSEDTTYSTFYQVAEQVPSRIKIGRVISGTNFLVVDSKGRAMPKHFPGELYLGGAGLSMGYFNNPQMTTEKFIYVGEQSERYYKTGDLVRLGDNDELDYLGRIDNQVKFRGYRIELSEIESVLNSVNQIVASQVILYGEGQAQQLVAFYQSTADKLDVAELRQELRRKLPSYMVPSVVLPITAMPLTSNGKLDKNSLLALWEKQRTVSHLHGRTLTQTERLITHLWQELLQLHEVPIDVSFNSLGGHSLLFNSLKQRLQQTFEIQLSFQKLFTYDTVELQAKLVEQSVTPQVQNEISDTTSSYSQLAQKLEQLAKDAKVPGISVSISRGHDYQGINTGWSNIAKAIPMSRSTGFRITCINKFLIALLVLREVDSGRVRLDQDLRADLPGGEHLEYPVTLTHLLTFSAGFDNSYLNSDVLNCTQLDTVIEGLLRCGNLFKPGTSIAYGAEGTLTLAWLLRSWTGHSWRNLLAEVFQLLGLGNTVQSAHAAQGYQRQDEGKTWSEIEYVCNVVQPDAIYDTIISSDTLVRFVYQMLFEPHSKLSDELIAQFKLRQVQISDSYSYETCSLGCFVNQGRLVFMSDGTGHTNFISIDLDDQEIISIHVNLDKEANVIEQAATMMGHGFFLNKEIEQTKAEQFVGCYRSKNVTMDIRDNAGLLEFTYYGPLSATQVKEVSGKLNFQNQVGFICDNDDASSSLGVCIPYHIGDEKYIRMNHYILKLEV